MSMNFDNFISKSQCKTACMKVTIYDSKDKVIGGFKTPEGFQLENYVMALNKDKKFKLGMTFNKGFTVSLYINDIYTATYDGKYIL